MMEKLLKIYDRLGDDESRFLFNARLKYSLTRDKGQYRDDVYSLSKYEFTDLFEYLDEFFDKKDIILFGAGNSGDYVYRLLNDYGYGDRVIAYSDNDKSKQGKTKNGLMIYSVEKICDDHHNAIILIASSKYGLEIYSSLLRMGIKRENIYFPRYKRIMGMTGIQYFDLPYLQKTEDDIYIDGGCFDGDSCLDFVNWTERKYKKIIAFEPNSHSRKKCEEIIAKNDIKNIEIIPKGLFSKETTLRFINKESGSRLSDDGDIFVDVTSLDYILKGDPATFIKLDIEGAELEALKGAKETILKHRPKLAICIYHKPEDIYELPDYILSLVPDYKLYIRQYSNVEQETILYAL